MTADRIGAVVDAALGRSARRVLAQLDAVHAEIEGELDVEAVHDARVAVRRVRSDLRTLAPLLVTERVRGLRSELAWLGGILGAVRDADVMRHLVAHEAEALDDIGREGARRLDERLAEARRVAILTLGDVMGSSRYRLLVAELHDLQGTAPFAPGADRSVRARVAAPQLVARMQRRANKAARPLGEDAPDAPLHELRKRVKQVRYAVELLGRAGTAHPKRRARRLADLQTRLGDVQDAVTAQAWLSSIAVASMTAEEAYAAGRLRERLEVRRYAARVRWTPAWHRSRP